MIASWCRFSGKNAAIEHCWAGSRRHRPAGYFSRVRALCSQGAHFEAWLEGIRSDVGGARRYCQQLRDRGLLTKDTRDHTIRIAPPLPITRNDVDCASDTFAEVLASG